MSEFDWTTSQITLNSTNVTADPSNAVYRYNFPGSIKFDNAKVAVAQCNIFFSWFNISAANDNNSYQFIFTDGGGSTTYTVTMDDGYYSIADMNTYLQSILISNGLYLVDSVGDFVYYIEILTNATFYAVQLNNYAFPTALPAGYTNPNALTFPGVASATQFIILDNAFQQIIGFNDQTIPVGIEATNQSNLSDFTPQVDTVQSVVIAANLINNLYSNPSSLLYPFTASESAGFGDLINVHPQNLLYLDVNEGYYNFVEITFLDQLFNKIQIQDTNVVVQLSFIVKKENISKHNTDHSFV